MQRARTRPNRRGPTSVRLLVLHCLRLCLLLCLPVCLPVFGQGVDAKPVDFDRDIKPIFDQACIRCHGADKQLGGLRLDSDAALRGGDSGKVILPGDGGASHLIQLVLASVPDDPDAVMPPRGKRLTAEQIQTLARWIDQGAQWPAGLAGRSSHWSLLPLAEPAVPDEVFEGWSRNPIDRFVAAQLKSAGLAPTQEATKRALIRRLSLDLIGLPPTPQEVTAFLNDEQPGAYDRLVDRLLDSPHYGERWARHWLDVVRFGESDGFERNHPRENAWHYRNWVIDALNRDMPYDTFVRMQLAGDVLAKDDPSMIAATGFLVAGPHNVTLPSSQVMRQTMQQDEYEELVGTIGQTFLGLTVNCARCHSHKFDPITQREYYGFVALVAGVSPGDRDVKRDVDDQQIRGNIAGLAEQRKAALAQLRGVEAAARDRAIARRKADAGPDAKTDTRTDADATPQTLLPQPVARWDFDQDLSDSIGQAHGQAINGATIRSGMLVVGGDAYVRTAPLAVGLNEKTLEAWVLLDDLNQSGGGVIAVQSAEGQTFDAIVFAEREPGRWMAGSNQFARTAPFRAPAETEADKQWVHLAVVYQADGTITGYRNGKPYGRSYRKTLEPFEAGQSRILLGLRHESADASGHLSARIDRAQLYDRALSAEQVAASFSAFRDGVSEAQLSEAMSDKQRAQRQAHLDEVASIDERIASLQALLKPMKVYAVKPVKPAEVRVLGRGNVTDPGEVVSPGGLAAVPGAQADFALASNASDAERRSRLAQWITDKDNALFARVIANRLWHYHFGTGIVDTPSDLGVNGAKPSHPQLLEYLAGEMIAQGYSLKQMHRLIVTSATYRQATTSNPQALAIDADNRLLWRMSPRRIDAEQLRDAILSVSGQLDLTVGGVGYRDVRAYMYKGSFFYDPIEPTNTNTDADEQGGASRRTVYRFAPRGAKKNLLDTFDCPDPSVMAPKRAVTTTPLQALTLMNNPFVFDMADRFAARAIAHVADVDGQVTRIYELAYARPPRDNELSDARLFIGKHGLPAFCRVIFNSNEFLYVQ